jgi:hypothetical protein
MQGKSSMRPTAWLLRSVLLVGGFVLLAQMQPARSYAGGSPYGPWWESFPDDPMGDSNPYNYYQDRGYNAPFALGASGAPNIFPYYGPGYYGARADSPYAPAYFVPATYAPYLYGHLGSGCDYHCGVGWW